MSAILQTLLGGLLALAGAFVGPFLQRKHDRWLAKRADEQILRQKAEELFAELDKIAQQSGLASTRVIEKLSNSALETVPLPDLGPVRAIATVYFPSILTEIDLFETDLNSLNKELLPELKAAGEKADAEAIKGLTVVMVLKHQQIANKLVKEIRTKMQSITPKFEGLNSQ